jgi:hypothetical protein
LSEVDRTVAQNANKFAAAAPEERLGRETNFGDNSDGSLRSRKEQSDG